jgi:serine phosphatase RsbU (regulator of sigma subunit)
MEEAKLPQGTEPKVEVQPLYGSSLQLGDTEATLLVVDDDPDILRVVRFYLSKQRYRVLAADSGKTAMELLHKDPNVELILSDVMMPEMSGLELLKAVKSDPFFTDVPVILISAEGDTAKKVAGLNLGADDFITKPFNFDELTARVRNHLRLRRLQRQVLVANDLLKEQNERFQDDLEAARTVQLALLPSEFPESPTLKIGSRYLPVDRVGGDFFDVVQLDPNGRTGVIVADVCGHGIAAALITAMTKISFRGACATDRDAGAVLSTMNRVLVPNIKQGFVTAFYVVYDPVSRSLQYASGGHPPLLVYRRESDRIEEFEAQATFLGSFDGVPYTSETVPVQPGDRAFLYTDGLYESLVEKGDRPYGMERVVDLIRTLRNQPIQAVLDGIVADLVRTIGDRTPIDDITLVGMDFL